MDDMDGRKHMTTLATIAGALDDELGLGLDAEGRWHRTSIARGIELREGPPPVDRAAGIIHGYSVITAGAALGHNMEIDQTTLDQVVTLGNQLSIGVKSRFDHPSASNTSMGTFLGRTKNFRRVGDRVLGDLHLSDSAKEAPQGDLYTYVLGLAERDPQAFGASIVFEGKSEYRLEEDGTRSKDKQGNPLPALARVETLLASDVVDDPAANAGGLFSKEHSLAAKISAFLNRWAQHDLIPQLQALMAIHREDSIMDTAAITSVQVEAARVDGHQAGVKAERERVASIHKSFAAVWGAEPPASECVVRDGLVELGTSAADADTKFKERKLIQITSAAPLSAGGGSETHTDKVDLSKLPLEDRCKAEWESQPALREEFGQLSTYLAFTRAEASGQAKVKTGR